MREELTQELLKILSALEVHSPASFTLAETKISADGLSFSEEKIPTVELLLRNLYFDCYCRRFDGVVTTTSQSIEPDEGFVQELSDANATSDRLDHGWAVHSQLPTGHYLVEKNGFVRTPLLEECVQEENDRSEKTISIQCLKESKTMHPGFYYIFGEAITDQQDDFDLLRFYWNLRASGAASFVRLLTSRLNRFQIPYRLKCVNNPAGYNRADASVLYVNKRFYRGAVEVIREAHRNVKESLRPGTPLFTKELAEGLGLAEEPATGESFGQHRCRIVAEGIWRAHEMGLQTLDERLSTVEKQFELNGLSFSSPYLNAGSVDNYELSF